MANRSFRESIGIGAFALLFSSISLFFAVPVRAQVAGASLSGTVMDMSGAVIPGATVSITNTATGGSRDVPTDKDGFYTAPNLIPGPYQISVSATGFATAVQSGVVLTVGAQQVLNVTMQVGTTTEKVQVTGEAPAVQLATSSVSAEVNSTTVRELPLNGRSWTDLATLQPGVDAIETQPSFASGTDRGNRGFGAQLTISGARPQENNYRLDGISLNDYGNGGPGNVLGGNMGVDAIQEFSVLTSNYSAEYGKTAGGVVNAITRSGTNQFHGSVYEFLRNSSLDGANFFDNSPSPHPKPPFRLNQFGASGGGPIRKDRTFVFADYEGLRRSKGIATTDAVPSPAARAGDLSTGTVTVDPAAAKYLPLFPLPNGPLLGNGDLGLFSFAEQQVVSENFFTTRIDHKVSDKDSLFGTYLYDDTPYQSPDNFDVQLLGSHTNRQIVVLEESHIFSPGLVNVVRGGYNRAGTANNGPVAAINPLAKDTSLASVPGEVAADLRISSIPEFLGGLGAANFYRYAWNSFQGYDDAFLTHGTHSLKFGVAAERMQLNYTSMSTAAGQWTFGSLSAFLTNQPKSFAATLIGGGQSSDRGLRQTLFGAYLQDDWRWRPNLTVNLGLRYEITTVPNEVQGKLVNLLNITDPQPSCAKPIAGCAPTPLSSLFSNPTLRNFEPRFGFAWDPSHNGKTAVRGGFGMFDMLPLPYQFLLSENLIAPFYLQGAVSGKNLPAGSFFSGAYPLLGLSSLRGIYIDHDPHRNYVMQWNMNIQRELLPNLTATVGYVGSRSVHLPYRTEDADMVLPTLTSQGYVWPSPVGTKLNPNFGRMAATFYEGNSFYDALELQLAKQMSHGVQLQGAFTWSRSIDTESGTMAGDQFSNAIAALDWFDTRLSRGVSDFNIGRTLVINAIWQVPGPKSASGLANWISNGWQLGGIFKASDGVPFTATMGSNGDILGKNSSKTFDYPDRIPGCNAINGNFKNDAAGLPLYINTNCFAVPSPVTLRGNSGRNILVGPGITDLDFSLFKNNYVRRISENFNVQFRAEFFNVLNHANFAVPATTANTDIFDASGSPTGVAGLLTSTSTDPREIQLALKITW
jgi:Carboxypeptidase regulatory-like domain/TonB dependent receptor-like, beta-barrel/TonB-dependent Receptor Plug Domain